MKYPHLEKAPITEALIDIQVKLPESLDIEVFLKPYKIFKQEFPIKEERQEIITEIKVVKGKPQPVVNKSQPIGYFFKTQDKAKLVQFRKNGYTFNKLRPYSSWSDIISEARRFWEIYQDTIKPDSITRIAVRYINHLNLPLPISDFSVYLTNPPTIREGYPPKLDGFLSKLIVSDPAISITSHITQQLDKTTSKYAVVILDIDVFNKDSYSSTDNKIWKIFENFHNIKNKIFFNSLTDNALELFK